MPPLPVPPETSSDCDGDSDRVPPAVRKKSPPTPSIAPLWAMTDFVKGQVPADQMIQPADIAEAVRYLLRTSSGCVVPEIQFVGPGGGLPGLS